MTATSTDHKLNRVVEIFHQPNRIIIMGVLNITPDSFSDGGKFLSPVVALKHALRMVDDGADIIDIGGESSRPGSDPVDMEEELRRVLPVIELLSTLDRALISIDTHKAAVAEKALKAGASIVNDITALTGDQQMAATVARHDAGLILMHKRGEPKKMQHNTRYHNIIAEIKSYLSDAVQRAESAGVDPRKIMLDPGIGFGKDLEGNLEILKSLRAFHELGKPVLIGASRKSFLGQITGADAENRLYGSVAAAAIAVMNGAAAVRVHDVKETRQAVDIAIRLRQA